MTRILITRAEPDGSAFAKTCRARGLEPILAPVMRIAIRTAPVDLSGIGALAFTSANGVRAFVANAAERALPVFAVGPVTAAAAKEAGFEEIHVAGGDAGLLASHIVSESALAEKAILHIAGEDRAGDLVALLDSRGVRARRQTLYQAVGESALPAACAAALSEDKGLVVSLFSPRTARLFLALAETAGLTARLGDAHAACLSAAVADEAARADWAGIMIAGERTGESLLDVVCRGRERA